LVEVERFFSAENSSPLTKASSSRRLRLQGPTPRCAIGTSWGSAGFEATSWYCIVAPAGVPKPIVTRLHTELVTILNVETTTPEELMAFVRVEIPK